MAEKVIIGGELEPQGMSGVVADARYIKDSLKNKTQAAINEELYGAIGTIDSEPTEDSQHAVSSGGVYSELEAMGADIHLVSSIDPGELVETDNPVAPHDYAAGDMFYAYQGNNPFNQSKFVQCYLYYVALQDGKQGDSMSGNLFMRTLSGVEALQRSLLLKYEPTRQLLNNNYVFAGVADSSLDPGNAEGVFYLATKYGSYIHFLDEFEEPLNVDKGLSVLFKGVGDAGWSGEELYNEADFLRTIFTTVSENYQPKGNYQPAGDYATEQQLAGKANTSDVYLKTETYNKTELDNLITTPNQEYVTVTATAQTADVTDLLPATGAADTIYRVGNWDGNQYYDTCYSEYSWNGSAYIKLSTKNVGIDDLPTAGSNNLVKSGGVEKELNIIEQNIEHFFTEGEDDFNICDDKGYVLINSKGGHLKTKNFDSSTLPELATQEADSEDETDLDIQDEKGYVIARFSGGSILTKENTSGIKIVGCLGDSLTGGGVNMGNYETTLQALLGGGYMVQNWGVGGEFPCTIMARLGISIITSSSYTLPANPQSSVLIGGNGVMMIRQDGDNGVAPLQQGSSSMVNPCYVQGIECTMTVSNWKYYLHRNNQGDRDVTIPKNEPILMNTGKGMGKNNISIVWMGENGMSQTTSYADKLLGWYKDVRKQLPNDKFIFIGLHKFNKQVGEYFEDKMSEEFGNKFFNIRTYCCTNMLYDAGITPTSEDIEDMENGICPASALSDGTHFKPATNVCIGTKLYQLIKNLGY